MRGSRRVIVKILLFQLDGCGHPQDDAMSSFFLDLKSSILGLSNEVLFVSKFFWEGGNCTLVTGRPKTYGGPCRIPYD